MNKRAQELRDLADELEVECTQRVLDLLRSTADLLDLAHSLRDVVAQDAETKDSVQVLGVRSDGTSVNLGTARMPAKMKAREIVQNHIGPAGDPDDDFDSSEATTAYRCCLDMIEYLRYLRYD